MPKEFDLLRHLVMRAPKLFIDSHLLHELCARRKQEAQYLRAFIGGLRQKLLTEFGVGYRLRLPS
jgi:DNA-binding response OmpR family regulator